MNNITNQPKTNLGGQHYKRAFTLIELLVVIAIIGILATVVIASLNSARNKGRIASIKSNLRNAITQAQIYHSENGTYTGLCNDTTIQNIISTLGGAGSASCFTPNMYPGSTSQRILDIDFGIATTYNNTHFTADPQGVLQLDTANTGGAQSWDGAMSACASVGKRISGASSLRALYQANNNYAPYGMNRNGFWSNTVDPTNSSNMFASAMSDGGVWSTHKNTIDIYVRCGI